MIELSTIEQPRYWKTLERHDKSAEYEDIKGRVYEDMIEAVKEVGIVDRKIVMHEGKVLEGWQLLRACIAADIKPQFAGIPEGMDADTFIKIKNDLRRHETPEQISERVKARRERVAAAKEEGKSERAIANEEGVSRATIQHDLEVVSGGHPCPPDHGFSAAKPARESEKVTGIDGKTYPAKKPVIRCTRCSRLWPDSNQTTPNCPMCKELRESKPKTKSPDKTDETPVDAFQNPLPKNCRKAYQDPWLQNTIDFLAVAEEKLRNQQIIKGMEKRKAAYPFINAKDVSDGIGFAMNYLDNILEHLKTNRPAGVCPECEGKGCATCKVSGMVPRAMYKELKK